MGVVTSQWLRCTRRRSCNGAAKVESSLVELVRLTGSLAGANTPAADKVSQDEVDRLLSEFGF